MAEISEESLLLMERTRSRLRDTLKDKGIDVAEDTPLDKLVELTEKEYYINEENKQDSLYKLLLGD